MSAGLVTQAAIRQVAEANAQKIVDMLRGADPNRPIPRSEWTVGEAAAHLAFTTLGLAMMARGLAIPYGDGTSLGLAEANEGSLMGFTDRDLDSLAEQLLANTRIAFDEGAVQPADRICPTPMGDMDVDHLLSYILVHHAMHGSAIATALRAELPFEGSDIPHMWPFISHVLNKVAVPSRVGDLTACFELRFGDDFSCAVLFDNGRVTSADAPPREVDCTISASSQTLFLVLARILTAREMVERNAMAITGPRADLGYGFADLFDIP